MSDPKAVNPPVLPSEIPIHFVKGNHFRVAIASGAWFGADPQGNFHLTFYSERMPLPKKIIMRLAEDGQFLAEDTTKRESKDGIVREMEIDIVMSIPAAQGLLQLLAQNLQTAVEASNELNKLRTP